MTAETGRMLRKPEVQRETGLSRATIDRLRSRGAFPQPVQISARAIAWPASVIEEWKNSRPSADHFATSKNNK